MGLSTIKAGSPDPDAPTSTAVLPPPHQLPPSLPLAKASAAAEGTLLPETPQGPSQSHHFSFETTLP